MKLTKFFICNADKVLHSFSQSIKEHLLVFIQLKQENAIRRQKCINW